MLLATTPACILARKPCLASWKSETAWAAEKREANHQQRREPPQSISSQAAGIAEMAKSFMCASKKTVQCPVSPLYLQVCDVSDGENVGVTFHLQLRRDLNSAVLNR